MDSNALLRPHEAAAVLKVTSRTLARWADEGLVSCVKTPGGQRRYREEDINQILCNNPLAENDNHGQTSDIDGSDTRS